MPIRYMDYNTNVIEALGVRSPNRKLLRFGAEIETGWHDEDTRNAFLRKLEDKGLSDTVIAKFDRSISAASCAEIVTLPLKYEALAPVIATVAELVAAERDKSSTASCGVHIHASRDALSTDTFWRVVQAIMVDPQAPANHNTWTALLGGMSLTDFSKGVEVVHAFWDSVALRRPTQYCMRKAYSDVMNACGPGSHQRAVIIGKRTPTVEFRLFKAARSPQVVRSYLEVVAALIEFATDPHADLLHPATYTTAQEKAKQAAHGMMVEYLLADENVRANLIDDHGFYEENLEGYVRGEVARGVSPRNGGGGGGDVGFLVSLILNGYAYERAEKHLRGLVWAHGMAETTYEKLCTLRNPLSYTIPAGIGAVSWKHGIFPVASFITFVTERAKVYPALAARFALPKFQRFVGGTYTVEEDNTPFDNDTPHDAIRVGCLCRDQLYYTGEVRVCHIRRIKTPVLTAGDTEYDVRWIAGRRGTSPANEAYMGDATTVSGDNILHICQGATRLEGHDE